MAASSGGLIRLVLAKRWPSDAPLGDAGDEIEVDRVRAEALLAAGIAEEPQANDGGGASEGNGDEGSDERKPKRRRRKG